MTEKTQDIQQYYSIGDVAESLAIPKHNIRLWESRFVSLDPLRLNGRRYYSQHDVDLIQKIYHLIYVEGKSTQEVGYIIDGATVDSHTQEASPKTPNPQRNSPMSAQVRSDETRDTYSKEPVTLVSIPPAMQKRLSALIREALDLRAQLDQTTER